MKLVILSLLASAVLFAEEKKEEAELPVQTAVSVDLEEEQVEKASLNMGNIGNQKPGLANPQYQSDQQRRISEGVLKKSYFFSEGKNLIAVRPGFSLLGGFGLNIGRIKYRPKSNSLSDTSIGVHGASFGGASCFYTQIPRQVWVKPISQHAFWGVGFSTGFIHGSANFVWSDGDSMKNSFFLPTAAAEFCIGLKQGAFVAEFDLSLLYGFVPVPGLKIGGAF